MTATQDRRPGSPGAPLWDPTAVPAATVIVLRDGDEGLEVLMLRRDSTLSFAGGMWVFPGGRIDPGDHPGGRPSTDERSLEEAALRAAVREAGEEAGLALDPAGLERWSHWTPPPESPKRYSTAFFVAALPADARDVVVDDREIRDHRWASPATVLELRDAGEVGLSPPTFISLTQLCDHPDTASALARARSRPTPEHFATRIALVGDDPVALYHGDVGYETGEPSGGPPLHRLVMGHRWTYVREP